MSHSQQCTATTSTSNELHSADLHLDRAHALLWLPVSTDTCFSTSLMMETNRYLQKHAQAVALSKGMRTGMNA
jgi:hypothetical protein